MASPIPLDPPVMKIVLRCNDLPTTATLVIDYRNHAAMQTRAGQVVPEMDDDASAVAEGRSDIRPLFSKQRNPAMALIADPRYPQRVSYSLTCYPIPPGRSKRGDRAACKP